MISLEGKVAGLMVIHLPRQSALEVSGAFLDLEFEEIDADVCDVVGELANITVPLYLDDGDFFVELQLKTEG